MSCYKKISLNFKMNPKPNLWQRNRLYAFFSRFMWISLVPSNATKSLFNYPYTISSINFQWPKPISKALKAQLLWKPSSWKLQLGYMYNWKKLQCMEKCNLLPLFYRNNRKFPAERKRKIVHGEFGDSPLS